MCAYIAVLTLRLENCNVNLYTFLRDMKNEIHANIGGGRDNVIRYNVFYNATKASIQVDGRGLGSGGHSVYLTGKLEVKQ